MKFFNRKGKLLLCVGLFSMFVMTGLVSCNPFVKIAKVTVVNDISYLSGTGVIKNSVTEVLDVIVDGNGQDVTQTLNAEDTKKFNFRWAEGNGDYTLTIVTITTYTDGIMTTNTASPADSVNSEYDIGPLGDGDEITITIKRESSTAEYEYSRENHY